VNSARAWLVWGTAVLAYVVAVLQRSSLGVSGVEAQQLFGISAATLSTLAVVQLAVYAGLQIPVGVMLDRVGPKALIVTGGVLLAVGQGVVALSPPVIGVAVVGRVLVGAGDAMTFISVMRLLPAWFRGPILPQVSQWTGNIGQAGQVLSALPLSRAGRPPSSAPRRSPCSRSSSSSPSSASPRRAATATAPCSPGARRAGSSARA
jgi:MFS family permease